MRLGAMVVGLLLAIWTYVEALQMIRFGDGTDGDGYVVGGSVVSALLCALASMIVLPFPFASAILFGLAAGTSLVVAMLGYGDHYLYGSTMVALAVMALLGWIRARREHQKQRAERARQRARDARLQRLSGEGLHASAPSRKVFPACGHQNDRGSKFCVRCGASISTRETRQ